MARGHKGHLLGSKFGALTVVEEHSMDKARGALWVCVCDCGNRLIRATRELRRVKRAGCQSCKSAEHTARCTTHGLSRLEDGRPDPLYKAWLSMRERCNNPGHPFYKNYGGKGVTICAEWQQFQPFAGWAKANGWMEIKGVAHGDRMSIDRIDSSGSYEPANCRIVTVRVNCSRKSG